MSDQPKSTPEQRAKWREAAALKKARREAGIPPRPYHKSNTTKPKETEQKMSTIAEQCEAKQPEVIETLVSRGTEITFVVLALLSKCTTNITSVLVPSPSTPKTATFNFIKTLYTLL